MSIPGRAKSESKPESPAVSLVYPPLCAGCGKTVSECFYLCATCWKKIKRIHEPFCHCCSEPFFGEIRGSFICAECEQRSFHFECAVASFRSRGLVRKMIHRFKYERQFHLRFPLAKLLLAAFEDPRISLTPIDALVPVPLHPTRRRDREFNQSLVLAKIAGAQKKITVRDCLRRIRNTETQTHFDREERMENLRNAFTLRKNREINNQHLLLVDDVFTTGSTADECARVLREAGAASVRAITAARG